MSDWVDCWPPNLPHDTLVRARVEIRLDQGMSYPLTVEDTAAAFSDFMRGGADQFDSWSVRPTDTTRIAGGTWHSTVEADDFTVTNP